MQVSLFATNEQLTEYALNNSPPEIIPEIQTKWRTLRLPTISEILGSVYSNPAIRPSNKSASPTPLILPDQDGHFHEYVEIDGQNYDIDNDLILWGVPGREAPRHDTGLINIHMSHDPTDKFIRGIHKHCNRPSCSFCSNYQIQKNTIAQAQKVENAHKFLMRTKGKKNAHLQHVEVSPPPSEWLQYLTPEGYASGRKKAYALIHSVGFEGGAEAFHPFRENKKNNEKTPEGWTPTEDNDLSGASARWGPHFHFVGMGFLDPQKIAEISARTGWVIKALRTGDEALKKPSDILPVLKYIKSHVGVVSEASPYQPPRAIQSINWVGVCSPNARVEVGGVATETEAISPETGAPLRNYLVRNHGDVEDKGLLYSKRQYPIYAPYSRRNEARALVEAHGGDPFGLLSELDKNPKLAVCVVSRRQFIGLCNPLSIKALDGTLHVVETIPTVYAKKGKRSSEYTPPPPTEAPPTSEASPIRSGTASEPREVCVPWIDYHLPVGAEWVG